MAHLMPLLLTLSCFSKIQIGFTFLVPAHPGSPGQSAIKRVCVCVCVYLGQSAGQRDISPVSVNLPSAFKNISVPGVVP